MTFVLPDSAALSASEWFSVIGRHLKASGVDLGDVEISTNSYGYDESLVETAKILYVEDDRIEKKQTNGVYQYKVGGFFAPITPENRVEATRAIFANTDDKGQWLLNYYEAQNHLKNKTLTPQQYARELQAIAKKLDLSTEQQYFVLLLNEVDAYSISMSDRWMKADDVSNYRADGTITSAELYEFFVSSVPRYGRDETPYTLQDLIQGNSSKGLKGMGDFAQPFIQYVGGIMQGRADFESARHEVTRVGSLTTYARHDIKEFDSMPPMALALLRTELNGVSLEQGLDFIDSLCGAALNSGRAFHRLPEKGQLGH